MAFRPDLNVLSIYSTPISALSVQIFRFFISFILNLIPLLPVVIRNNKLASQISVILGTTTSEKSCNKARFSCPRRSLHLSAYSRSLDTEERKFRLLCERYWGKGGDGKAEIFKKETVFVPYMVRAVNQDVENRCRNDSPGSANDPRRRKIVLASTE
jgi:hypothetical protein